MRSFALSLALATPCMIAACGTPLDGDGTGGDDDGGSDTWGPGTNGYPGGNDGDGSGSDGSGSGGNGNGSGSGTEGGGGLVVDVDVTSPDCYAPVASYAVTARIGNGAPLAGLICHIEFDNGTSSDSCSGLQNLGIGGSHAFTVNVSDPESGYRAEVEHHAFVYEPMHIDFAWTKPSCGLSFDVNLSVPESTAKQVTISPAANIVGGINQTEQGGHFDVLAAGTYTLTANVEQLRPNGPLCSDEVVREVTVEVCDHEHTPACADWP